MLTNNNPFKRGHLAIFWKLARVIILIDFRLHFERSLRNKQFRPSVRKCLLGCFDIETLPAIRVNPEDYRHVIRVYGAATLENGKQRINLQLYLFIHISYMYHIYNKIKSTIQKIEGFLQL